MKYDYFLASRYRNKPELIGLTRQIRTMGKKIYCFVESEPSRRIVGELDADPESSMQKFEAIADWHDADPVREIYETDMAALRNSEALILLLPAGKSSHIEAGVAFGLGKKLILIGEQRETESLYLIFEQRFATIEQFLNSI